MAAHVHYYVPVSTTDWQGKQTIVRRCACGDTLTPQQIAAAQSEAGEVD